MASNELSSKEAMIKKEVSRLNKIFKELDKNRKSSVDGLIQEAAFMRATLHDLKNDINENGVLDNMQQGEYSILRESPALKSYNSTIQRYTTVMKELFAMLPKEVVKKEDDGFENFVQNK